MELTGVDVERVFLDCLFREGEPTENHVSDVAVKRVTTRIQSSKGKADA